MCLAESESRSVAHTSWKSLKRSQLGFPLIGFPLLTVISNKLALWQTYFDLWPLLYSILFCLWVYTLAFLAKYFLVTVNIAKYVPNCSKIRIWVSDTLTWELWFFSRTIQHVNMDYLSNYYLVTYTIDWVIQSRVRHTRMTNKYSCFS